MRLRESEAAALVRESGAALAARGCTVIDEVLGAAAGEIVDWRHYPAGEVYDPKSHAQYFYHRHPAAAAARSAGATEHGHFHLFLRGDGIPAGISPLLLPDAAVANAPVPRQSAPLKRGARDEVCHIAAIALDAVGRPVRIFTTNRWVTGESWYRAEDMIALLDRFRIDGDNPSAVLNRWLTGVVRLFQPELAALLRKRDRAVVEQRWRWRSNVLEDQRLEITSSIEIDLEARLMQVEQLPRGAVPAAASRVSRLPPMAEGWGA